MDSTEKAKFLEAFGSRVKKYRIEKELSQEALANLIGYTSDNARSSINKIEAGKSDLPASKIRLLAQALGVPIGSLMGWYDEFDKKYDTQKIQKEINLIEQIEQQHGRTASEAFGMYVQLDSDDQGKIRGEMKQMLKAEKYSAKDGSSSGKAI